MKQATAFVLLVVAILFLYFMESPWWGYVIAIAVILGIMGGNKSVEDRIKAKEKALQKLNGEGIQTEKFLRTENYIGGHPDINSFLKNTVIYKNNNDFEIYVPYTDQADISNIKVEYSKEGIIPIQSIKNISIEDKTTIDKRVSLGRAVLFGPLAFGMQKTIKKEEAYLNISWNDGKFDHETLFQFQTLQDANIARNELIKATREDNGQKDEDN
jgi:hypothetical protein